MLQGQHLQQEAGCGLK